ncbi:Uncharacterised protein [Yersinia enterocolitica]|uniref:Uncharacterized protein n=1 Tax=Proteus terrae subsp. cibarius TaxID=626774 RepID=A0ABX6JXB4_9GAMM|nr:MULTISPECIES: hypothetical protein [Enterobacterales]MBU5964441.1 hypothetical protein [Proteus mirabilis]QHD96438.1 hypothetical protein GSM99_18745 [Proteus terrae subsp. cibarius]QIF92321.1 hypothetical protein GTH23_19960 [Proteus terrae subsp. cibarius]QJW53108.1 hypothetical protein HND96_19655 [Proteus terrae subsp. cibarius]CQQ96648.1 Uncharacterised protein [Yersinia enterocolitica]
MRIKIDSVGEAITAAPLKRIPRGRKRISEILAEIDSAEIQRLNKTLKKLNPMGKEVI